MFSPSRTGSGTRRWIYAWLLLIAVAWAMGLAGDVEMLRWAETTPDMCQGLPDYAAAASALPTEGPVGFLSEVPDPGNSERFFCAQFDLAPRLLMLWRPMFVNLSQRQLAGTTVMLNFDDLIKRNEFLRDLDAEAERQNATVARRDLSDKLTVVSIREKRLVKRQGKG
ncbi:MAG TPA: hypothetical protein VH394_22495 [Thermoanaerobaculia bacterium]|jgi:hypothetical protein|nr:hypothetical protein [Thermoanaerobaculia bacterium]